MSKKTELLFLDSRNSKTRRYAVLEDNGSSCWLYLTIPGSEQPEKSCFVYSPIDPIDQNDFEKLQKTGDPPVLTKDLASSSAIIRHPSPKEFAFEWSTDGQFVAVNLRGKPIAMIVNGEENGYSKAFVKASFFGEPWNDELYLRYFK